MKFILREGLKKLKNYKKLTFATFLTSTISYLVLGIFLLITLSIVESFNTFQQSETKMVAFVSSEATEDNINTIKNKLEALNGITSIEYISNDEGLKNLEQDFDQQELVNEFKEDNPLPHTYIISFNESRSADIAYKVINSLDGVQKVEYEKEYLNEITKTFKNFKMVLICIVSGLLISSVFFIVIVISLSIYNQQKNIKIMLVTGAPVKYISRPFIVQGVLISLSSAIISAIATIHLHKEYIIILEKVFPFMNVLTPSTYNIVPVLIIILGLVLGLIGSTFAAKVEIRKVIKRM